MDKSASASPKPSTTKGEGYNAGDPNQVAERQKQSKVRETQRVNGLRQTMQKRDGRLWVRNLLENAHVFHTSFTGNSGTFFNEGERNQALKVLADLSAHCVPELLVLFAEGSPDAQGALNKALAILNGNQERTDVGPAETA
jgi:hypothetical protein